MWKALRKTWRYMGTWLNVFHAKHADPEVQLEQAIEEAKSLHKRLTDQAANVIANQQQVQRRLDRTIADLDRAESSARQALLLADREERSGDTDRAAGLLRAAESCAEQSLTLETQVRELEQQLLDATRSAQEAKAAVAANAEALRRNLAQREKLLATLDQARTVERINAAMAQINSTQGDIVPTVAQVKDKIEARLDRAKAQGELAAAQTPTIDAHMLEIEQAQRSIQAQARLAEMRSSLGLTQPAEVVRHEPRELPR